MFFYTSVTQQFALNFSFLLCLLSKGATVRGLYA